LRKNQQLKELSFYSKNPMMQMMMGHADGVQTIERITSELVQFFNVHVKE
jgi:hypothetical protein